MAILVFDIETVPDTVAGRSLNEITGTLDERQSSEMMLAQQRAKNGADFLPHYLHKIVAISVLLAQKGHVKLWSLGESTDTEKVLIERFWAGIDKYQPTLVSWNGSGFDLPVLHYRTLFNKLQATQYWEVGEKDSNFKWNNYLNRYHLRHLDVMDMLSGYQNRAFGGLDAIASLCGLPGKQGMSGGSVLERYLSGDIEHIRNYCETDVLNTYLVYLRFEWMRGQITQQAFDQQFEAVLALAQACDKSHLNEFVSSIAEEYRV